VEHGLNALVRAARKLSTLDPERFLRVVTLCEAYLDIYESGPPSPEELIATCEIISPRKQRDPTS
jgi:hypothetical protein